MKKRIISWFFLVVMVMTTLLTSCSDVDSDYLDDDSTPAITLTLWGVKGEGTTEEAIDLVETKINRITEDKYRVIVDLKFFEEDVYDEEIEKAFVAVDEQLERNELAEKAASAAAKAAREAAKKLSLEEQKEKKRAQREYEKWAQLQGESIGEVNVEMSDDVQLDIFMVDDYNYFSQLIENDRITDISSQLTGSSSIISKFVNPIILSVGKQNSMYYGVPVNRMLGTEDNEGYYYAFRTDLVEKYGLEIPESEPVVLNNIDAWLESVNAGERCVTFFAPPAVIQSFDYYNNDMENYPAYGTRNYETRGTTSSELEFTFDMGEGVDAGVAYVHYKRMSKYRSLGYFAPEGADPKTTDFAVGIFQGTLDKVKETLGDRADDYTYGVYSYPKVTTTDAFGSAFVVSTSCKDVDRAVKLISGFCTVESLRNLITFGVEDVHYEVNLDGETITKISNDYNIGFEDYGNALIGYVPEELGADYQQKAMDRNRNAKVSAFIGYTGNVSEDDIEAFEKINEIAKEYVHDLMNGVVEIDAMLEEATTRMGKYEDVLGVYDPADDEVHVPTYNTLLLGLNGGYSAFASSRPSGAYEVTTDIITKEEKEKRKAEAEKEALEKEQAEAEAEAEAE